MDSKNITLALYGGDLGIDVVVSVSGERLGAGDYIIDDNAAASIADGWARDYPVSRNWTATSDGSIVLVDGSDANGRPSIHVWSEIAPGKYAIGEAPVKFSKREFVRTVEDHAALDKIAKLLILPGHGIEEIAAAIAATGRVVL